MSDIKLTNEKMKTFDGKSGAFKTGAALKKFGDAQNEANEALAANVNDLIRRVCALEDEQLRHAEAMKKLASELSSAKAEIDRLRLTAKLNTSAIQRMSNAVDDTSE